MIKVIDFQLIKIFITYFLLCSNVITFDHYCIIFKMISDITFDLINNNYVIKNKSIK